MIRFFTILHCLLLGTVMANWIPGTVPNAFQSILVKEEGYVKDPVIQSRPIFKTPWNGAMVDACVEGHALNISCFDFFCDPGNMTRRPLAAVELALAHNYCYFCEIGSRNRKQFVEFHSMLATSKCPRFISFTNATAECNGARTDSNYTMNAGSNKPWLFYRAINVTMYDPFLCYCTSLGKLATACDAMSAFFDDFAYEVAFILYIIYSLVILLVVVLLIVVPECGLRCRKSKASVSQTRAEYLVSFLAIRMQSIYFLVLGLTLFVAENCYELAYVSTQYKVMKNLPNGVIYIISVACIFMSYAPMLLLWSSVYTKANEGNTDAGLDLKHRIAALFIYLVITATMVAMTICVLATPNTLIAYAIVIVVAMLYMLAFPIGFTIYGGLILSFRAKFGDANHKITLFMILSNLFFVALIVLLLPMGLTYLLGWDYLSPQFGTFRFLVLFTVPVLLAPPMVFILFVAKRSFIAHSKSK